MHRKQPTEIGLGLNGNSRQRRTAARKWAALGYYVRHFGGGIGQVVLSPTPFRLGEARMAPARVPPNVEVEAPLTALQEHENGTN